jgi:hypothetical protein
VVEAGVEGWRQGAVDYFRENAPRNFRWRFGMPRRMDARHGSLRPEQLEGEGEGLW